MQTVKIVVWDNIGNVLLGVRPWNSWAPHIKERLVAEDQAGPANGPSFDELFADYEVKLTWFQDATRTPTFGDLADDYASSIRPLASMDELGEAIADADFVVLHKEHLPAAVLKRARRLKLLQHLGQDYRGVPLEAARELKVPVAAVPLVNYLAVAEHVWAFILNHLKQLPAQRPYMLARGYTAETWGTFPNLRLARDQTLGLLGFGEIARPIARIAQAFEMPTLYWDVVRFPEFEARYGVGYVPWDELFRRADVLSVQLALNEQTQGIIGDREFGLMKPTTLFVNTARGKLVDQPALVRALTEGRLGGAALDVFADEPLPVDDPLHALHERLDANVTLTPHDAWQSPWTWVRDSHGIWLNVLRALRGEPVQHLVHGA